MKKETLSQMICLFSISFWNILNWQLIFWIWIYKYGMSIILREEEKKLEKCSKLVFFVGMRTVTNYFLLNLSIADIGITLFCTLNQLGLEVVGVGLYNLLKAFLSLQSDCSPHSTQLWLPGLSYSSVFSEKLRKRSKKLQIAL